MSAVSWILFAAAALAAIAVVTWHYRRRETPGRGRTALAALRGGVIAILLLLLFDPTLPGAVLPGADSALLLDESLSMMLPSGTETRWAESLGRARRNGTVILFGDAARPVPSDSLRGRTPRATRSRLLPALQAASEAGWRRVTVVTDGAIDDADDVIRWLPRLGLAVDMQVVGAPARNRGLVRVTAPSWVETGEQVQIAFEVAATGGEGGPVTVRAREGERVLAETVVETPAEGRVATGVLRFEATPPASGELARYDISIEGGDVMADDDARSVYVRVSAEPSGAVLVSFAPDWEPRFLQPVLERALGMAVRGYLRAGSEWVTLGTGLSVASSATDADVRRAVDRAELLVVHAFGERAPAWAREAVEQARRLLVMPVGNGQVPGLELPPTGAVAGDWYLTGEIPPSPVAPSLAGMDVRDVPPLTALRIPGPVPNTWAPAAVSRGRRGPPYPLALGGTTGGRRWVVALGSGYWRWAFWSESAREVYQRLWSAVGGWLVADPMATGPDAIGPANRVVARGAPVRWVTGGLRPDSLRVRVNAGDSTVFEATVAVPAADTVSTPPLAPGHYTYAVRAYTADAPVDGEGPFTVESYSDDYTRPAVDPARLEAAPVALRESVGMTRPLHASVWPYVLLILLLSAEWVLRRRWGLR